MKNNNLEPLVSIIMPVYNAGDFLVEAIESILAQTYQNWELILVDDKSTDNSLKILKDFTKQDERIKVLKNRTNRGISFSLNKALWYSQGKFIARMDADDVSLPQRIEKQVKFLQRNKEIVACGGNVEIIDREGNFLARKEFPSDSQRCYRMIMKMVPTQHACLMTRAGVMKKYRYLENSPTAEDVDMFFYLLSKGKMANVSEIIYQYRKAESSNGYHNVKQTFYITFRSRFKAIFKYGYRPSISGVFISLMQFILVTLLPARGIVYLFETLRFRPSFLKKISLRPSRLIPALSR